MPPLIQRVVHSKIIEGNNGEEKTVYYSTYDTKTVFDNAKDAWDHDEKRRVLGKVPSGRKKKKLRFTEPPKTKQPDRYPTNFTYYFTKPWNLVSPNKQGPHSLSYSSLHHRMMLRLEEQKISEIVKEQIDSPEIFISKVDKEAPDSFTEWQKKRMLNDYRLLHDRITIVTNDFEKEEKPSDLKKDEEEEFISNKKRKREEAQEILLRLTQMDPYTAYGKKEKMSKKKLKNKGERKEDNFDKAFDPFAKFNDQSGYEEFKNKRKKLFDPLPVKSTNPESNQNETLKKPETPFLPDFDPKKLDFGLHQIKKPEKMSLNFLLNPTNESEKVIPPPFQFPKFQSNSNQVNNEEEMKDI